MPTAPKDQVLRFGTNSFNVASYFVDTPAAQHPERTAIVGEPTAASYGELAALVARAGNALRAQGVGRGDRVLIVLLDSVEFFAAFFGAAKIGAVAVPVNPFARANDYIHYIENCEPRLAVVHSEALAEFLPASSARPQMPIILAGNESSAPHGVALAHWSAWIAAANDQLLVAETAPGDPAFLLYTSGSGGAPKAALHRHADMLFTSRNYAQEVVGLRAGDLTFSASKLFFAYGLGNGMYFPLSVGARTLLNPLRTSADVIMDMVARHHPTVFFAVPTLYATILRETERSGHQADFSSVRACVSAGETLPAEIFNAWKRRFHLEILDGIGSTEMLHIFLSSRAGKCVAGSCGSPVPGYEVRIVDDDGNPLPAGETGNLWVRGESAFAEYWRLPDLTVRTKRDGWVVTGDKFSCDTDGYYHYCGRADDMLKVAGMWVSPVEVENVLLGHPLIVEAAVVGSADTRGLTCSVAHVVLRAGGQASENLSREILEHLKARLAAYKVPREVHFCAELPKTVTGKIQRFKLR